MKAKRFAASALAAVFLLSATPAWAAPGISASESVYAKADSSKATKKKAKKNTLSAEAAEEMVKKSLDEIAVFIPELNGYKIDTITEQMGTDINGNPISALVALLVDKKTDDPNYKAHLKLNAATGEVIIFDHFTDVPQSDDPLDGSHAIKRAGHFLDLFLGEKARQFEYSNQYTYSVAGYSPDKKQPERPLTLVTFTPKKNGNKPVAESVNVLIDADGELHRYLLDVYPSE